MWSRPWRAATAAAPRRCWPRPPPALRLGRCPRPYRRRRRCRRRRHPRRRRRPHALLGGSPHALGRCEPPLPHASRPRRGRSATATAPRPYSPLTRHRRRAAVAAPAPAIATAAPAAGATTAAAPAAAPSWAAAPARRGGAGRHYRPGPGRARGVLPLRPPPDAAGPRPPPAVRLDRRPRPWRRRPHHRRHHRRRRLPRPLLCGSLRAPGRWAPPLSHPLRPRLWRADAAAAPRRCWPTAHRRW